MAHYSVNPCTGSSTPYSRWKLLGSTISCLQAGRCLQDQLSCACRGMFHTFADQLDCFSCRSTKVLLHAVSTLSAHLCINMVRMCLCVQVYDGMVCTLPRMLSRVPIHCHLLCSCERHALLLIGMYDCMCLCHTHGAQ